MSNEFKPYHAEIKKSEFSAWVYQGDTKDEEPGISAEENLVNECENLKQEAFNKGYADGLAKAQTEIDSRKKELIQWIEFLQKPVQLLDDQVTQEIIQTIIWLCQHCIGVELSVHPDKFYGLFKEIKDELPSLRGNKLLGMNPIDVDWVKAEIHVGELPGLDKVIFPDPSLDRGDFYLKDEHSELDGRIQTRLLTLFAKYIDKDNLITPIKSQD